MGRLIYSANTSLDGFITDREGRFDWSVPDSAYHSYITELIRPATTHLYGRRMYDVMAYWETFDEPEMQDFASNWRAAEKIVYSRSLTEPWTQHTQIVHDFDAEQVRSMIAAAEHDFLIGGAEIAGQALAADLVDDVHDFIWPLVLGGRTRWLPDDVQVDLELVDEHRLTGGVVHLHYRVNHRP